MTRSFPKVTQKAYAENRCLIITSMLYFLSLTLDSIPIGVVYAIWSGAGIVGIAILSWIIYGQNLDLGTGIGMALIIAGIIVMRLYSNVDFA